MRARWRSRTRRLAGSVLPVLLASPCSDAGEVGAVAGGPAPARAVQQAAARPGWALLRPQDTLGDLLRHPAFRGFARLLLPWDGRTYDEGLPLQDIGQLLPYHSHVDPAVVVAGLNRMVDDIAAGRTVFHDMYTASQKQALPRLHDTGLFFFRGRPGAPFAVIAPGGGFSYVGSVHEGFPYAEEISRRGFNAFVLKYRAGEGGGVATEDLAAAVATIVRNAAALQVGTSGYSLWGSSAGARMAAAIGSHGTGAFGATPLPKPAVVVMAYTGHREVTAAEPATFAVVGERDGIAPPGAMEARVAALRRAGTHVAYHVYPGLGHGFGTGQGTAAQGWIGNAVQFWEQEIRKTP